jgi:hypothetical protein
MAIFRSSIFSFDTFAFQRMRVPKGALLALGIVVLCEVGLHVFADRLPDPVLWGAGEASAKVAQAEALGAAATGGIDVLILGPSHASVGISPHAILDAADDADLSVYNGGINGRDYPVLQFIFEQVYLPSLRPKVIVLTASSIIFNLEHSMVAGNTLEFFEAPMPKALSADGLAGRWRRFLVNHVYLYRYRKRERGLVLGLVGGKRLLDDLGYHELNGEFDEEQRERLFASTHGYRGVWEDYEFGGMSADAFVSIIARAEDHGIKVVVVNMPFRPELLELPPGDGEAGYREYLKAMEELRGDYKFHWLDYQARMELSDADFRDVDHLNSVGTTKLSARLAEDIRLLEPDIFSR